jgi:hypothetical protein
MQGKQATGLNRKDNPAITPDYNLQGQDCRAKYLQGISNIEQGMSNDEVIDPSLRSG